MYFLVVGDKSDQEFPPECNLYDHQLQQADDLQLMGAVFWQTSCSVNNIDNNIFNY